MEIIIPVCNMPSFTKACLDSLLTVKHGTPIRPIIVDNGSRIKTRNIISNWADQAEHHFADELKIVTLPENKGFSGGVNAGLAVADKTKVVAIMHNDVIPTDGWASELELALSSDEDVAIAVPRTCYANEGSPIFNATHEKFSAIKPCTKDPLTVEEILSVVERSTLPEIKNKLRQSFPMRFNYSPEISSFCMAVRPGLFNEFGKFNEDFQPRGYEDKFWFLNIEKAGMYCMIANYAYVHHFGNMTSDGPGFDFPMSMKNNKEIFDTKRQALCRRHIKKGDEMKIEKTEIMDLGDGIKFIKRDQVRLPEYKTAQSVGADVFQPVDIVIPPKKVFKVETGLKMTDCPRHFEIQIRMRSGWASKGIMLANGVGSLDSDYRGDICLLLYNSTDDQIEVKAGERIVQLVPMFRPDHQKFSWSNETSQTERGDGGFGSTGK